MRIYAKISRAWLKTRIKTTPKHKKNGKMCKILIKTAGKMCKIYLIFNGILCKLVL